MLIVISQHLEHEFSQREPILEGLKVLEFGGVPDTNDVSIDGPNDIVKEVAEKCHQLLQNIDYLKVKRLF